MLPKTKNAMIKFAQTLEPSTTKANCYAIANLEIPQGSMIALELAKSHSDTSSHLRDVDTLLSVGGSKV